MTRVEIGGVPDWVFFVSFEADTLSRALANSQIYGYQMLLMRRDIPDLIEIAAAGSRQGFTRISACRRRSWVRSGIGGGGGHPLGPGGVARSG